MVSSASLTLGRGRLSEYLTALAEGDGVAWFILLFFVASCSFTWYRRRHRRRYW